MLSVSRELTKFNFYGLIHPIVIACAMKSPDNNKFNRYSINPDLLSRGSGERILLQDATVYDYMPKIIGSRFASVPDLRRSTHFYGDLFGPFLSQEAIYTSVAEEELRIGNLTSALEAYKRGLHAAVSFVGGMSLLQDVVVFTKSGAENLNLERFGKLEERLTHSVISQEVAFNQKRYVEWLSNVRGVEQELRKNKKGFWMGTVYPDAKPGDPDYIDVEIGARLMGTYEKMQRFGDAAEVAARIGDTASKARFDLLAKTDPKEHPKVEANKWYD